MEGRKKRRKKKGREGEGEGGKEEGRMLLNLCLKLTSQEAGLSSSQGNSFSYWTSTLNVIKSSH